MEIMLNRRPSYGTATIGDLYIGNVFECYTLEDVIRPPGVKIYGQTAIPEGRYRIVVTKSDRFSQLAGHDVFLPLLLDVPDYVGVRIHAGNKPQDTDGCLLTGRKIGGDRMSIVESVLALESLQPKIESSLNSGEEVWITINNPSELKQ